MISFVPTAFADVPHIKAWVDVDPWHSFKDTPEWWVSGGYLTFKVVDARGTVFYVRFDRESGTVIRLHTQFAPTSEVNEKRTALGIIQALAGFIPHAKANGVTGIITQSSTPKLVAFLCNNFDFVPVQDAPNDYMLTFKEGQ